MPRRLPPCILLTALLITGGPLVGCASKDAFTPSGGGGWYGASGGTAAPVKAPPRHTTAPTTVVAESDESSGWYDDDLKLAAAAPVAASKAPATENVEPAPAEPSNPEPAPTPAPKPAKVAAESDVAASLAGLDRSHWPQITVGPEQGRVEHNPVYYEEPDLARHGWYENHPMNQRNMADALARAFDATEDTALTWGEQPARLVQPLRFYVDTVILPIRMLMDPPLSVEDSPLLQATEPH